MKIAYTTTFNAEDVHSWSGAPFFMSNALKQTGLDIDYIGSLKRKLPPFFKVKQAWKQLACQQRESPRFNTYTANHYSRQLEHHLKNRQVDAILSPLINPIAYLNTNKPIALWTDALYSALVGFYPPFSTHSASTIKQGNEMTAACLSRLSLAIFCSDWAANSAIQLYGVSKEKVHVVPFGANIDSYPSYETIQSVIKLRDQHKIKLLFLAKSWERKGGDVVLAVAKALHDAGHPVELTIVGYNPPGLKTIPSYINALGYISKQDAAGKNRIQEILASSHFLFVPSRAEAYGIVFCEANAFGVPALTTHVGGIGTIIKDNINGMTFGLDASVATYCDYIVNLMQDRKRYEDMALAAYNEYVTRLNWQVSLKLF
jgi:glycosyltransferase involved in cell wall biosynthesis